MIAKAKSISHGINDIRYITGESRNKKHPERIYHVKDNLLPPGLDATGIWDSMRLTLAKSRRVKNSVIRIEVSPAPEHTKDFTIDDWRKLWDDFIDEFDNIELCDKNGRTYSPKTNLRGSKGSIWLHEESPPSRRVLPHRRAGACQQRPRHPSARAAGGRACGPETGLDDRRRGAGYEHRAGEP